MRSAKSLSSLCMCADSTEHFQWTKCNSTCVWIRFSDLSVSMVRLIKVFVVHWYRQDSQTRLDYRVLWCGYLFVCRRRGYRGYPHPLIHVIRQKYLCDQWNNSKGETIYAYFQNRTWHSWHIFSSLRIRKESGNTTSLTATWKCLTHALLEAWETINLFFVIKITNFSETNFMNLLLRLCWHSMICFPDDLIRLYWFAIGLQFPLLRIKLL